MALAPKIGPLELGNQKLFVNCSDYSYDKVEELRERVAEVRRKQSIFGKYPMSELETKEKWRLRVEPIIEADTTRKVGEEVTDHLKRMFELKSEVREMAPEILNIVCDLFGMKEVPLETFKKSNWLEVKNFIFNVLNLADVACADFEPKTVV